MQHNWWIAALQYFGLISADEGEHISNEIRNSIHPERYKDAYKVLKGILDSKWNLRVSVLEDLQDEVRDLRTRISDLENKLAATDSKPETKKVIATSKKV